MEVWDLGFGGPTNEDSLSREAFVSNFKKPKPI